MGESAIGSGEIEKGAGETETGSAKIEKKSEEAEKKNLQFNLEAGEVFLINKPLRWTSFNVISKIRHTLKMRKLKVGHAGTLDPLASGLLIVCTGKATKSIELYQGQQKTYEGTFSLGATTPSYDLESEIDFHFETSHITTELLEQARKQFIGEIEQFSPAFSALKIKGERAYEVARRGENPEIKCRKVIIDSFELDSSFFPEIKFKVVCSKGTYIRSLAHDLGKQLKSGAYLSSLVRTAIGDLRLEDAWELDELAAALRNYKGFKPARSVLDQKQARTPRFPKGFHEKPSES